MRPHSDQLAEVLTDSFSRRLIADVFHGTERVMEDLPLIGWSLDGDLFAEVKHGGRGTVVHNSVQGESLTPEGTEGVLSPFRARLFLLMEITAGDFSETIALGWFRITDVPYAKDSLADVNGQSVIMGSVVELVLESLDIEPRDRGFKSEEQPPSLASVYGELRRIAGLPILETVPDRAIPAPIVYEATQGGRLKGMQSLAALLGGRLVPNSSGALVVIPDAPGDIVGSLEIGPNGTVTDVPYSVDTKDVYNCIVGNFEDADRNPIFEVAEATVGPLATSGFYAEKTLYVTSQTVQTRAAAKAFVDDRLAQSTGTQNFNVPIQCIVNPLFELGDPLDLKGHVRPLKGRLVKYSISDSPMMTVTLASSRAL